MRLIITSLFIVFSFVACQQEATPLSFAQKVEAAHGKDVFLAHQALQFDIVLTFGGNELLNGKMTLTGDGGRGRIDYADGKTMIFNGDKVFYSTEFDNPESVRFGAYTWSYFFMLPYKLSDPGTKWSDFTPKTMAGKTYDVEKLSFAPGTGDAPDDWDIVYTDPATQLTHAAAYIVTAGQSQAEAEKSPSAIQYLDYQTVNGVQLAHQWKFWKWNAETGLNKERGGAVLSNFKFLTKEDSVNFEREEGFLEI